MTAVQVSENFPIPSEGVVRRNDTQPLDTHPQIEVCFVIYKLNVSQAATVMLQRRFRYLRAAGKASSNAGCSGF